MINPKNYQFITRLSNVFFLIFSSNTLLRNIKKMARKSIIAEAEYHERGDNIQEHYHLLRLDNSSDFTQICWGLQGFPIRKDSTIKYTSIWQWRYWRALVQEFSTVPDVTHNKTS